MIAATCCGIVSFNVKCTFLSSNTIVNSKISPNNHDSWLVIFWLVAGFVERYSGDSRSRYGKKQVAAQFSWLNLIKKNILAINVFLTNLLIKHVQAFLNTKIFKNMCLESQLYRNYYIDFHVLMIIVFQKST